MGRFIQGVTNYDEWRDHSKDNKKYKERMAVISEMLSHKNCLSLSDQIRLAQCLAVSELTGKLEDFWAVSSSVLMNPFCQGRAKCPGCICKDCYAAAGASRFAPLAQALETNYLILTNFLLSEEALATVAIPSSNGKGRIEAHGDVANTIQAINYTRLVASHKHLDFGVWSKNLEFYFEAFESEGKPDNESFIASSPIVNKVMEVPEYMSRYVDHVFTVWEEEYAREHHININCGTWDTNALDHRCKNCLRCYDLTNADYYINELKK